MGDYKQPKCVTDAHCAFQLALELKTYDYTRDAAGLLAKCGIDEGGYGYGYRVAIDHLGALNADLMSKGLLKRTGRYAMELTPEAFAWGQVFQLRPDGTFVIFESTIDEAAWPVFVAALDAFAADLRTLKGALRTHFTDEYTTPARLRTLDEVIGVLKRLPDFPARVLLLDTYREVAVLACRGEKLRLHKRVEELELRARDREVIEGTKRNIELLAGILAIPGLAGVTASKPRVSDFVNVGILEAARGRATDEKFSILAAPTLFSPDFIEISEAAISRGRSFAVGFIDIDKFKDFNSKHLETVVDQDMLPNFMRALEAYCYGRAFAYRQGGDEYLVLLRNANEPEARAFFESLQTHIAQIEYPDTITDKPQVSIGVHVIDGDHEVTVFEAKKLANEAKDKAKKAGRNCVRFSTDPWPESVPED